jgi:hypothetical protein
MREYHVRICEGLGVKLPGSTRRNLRGDDGNVGIIRSPIRAIVLPDRYLSPNWVRFHPTEWNQVPRERRASHGKRTNPRRGVPVAKGDRRRPGRVGEQSYEPILPLKVANRRAPRKGAATVPTGGKGRTGGRIDGAPHTRDIELGKVCQMELSRITEGANAGRDGGSGRVIRPLLTWRGCVAGRRLCP